MSVRGRSAIAVSSLAICLGDTDPGDEEVTDGS